MKIDNDWLILLDLSRNGMSKNGARFNETLSRLTQFNVYPGYIISDKNNCNIRAMTRLPIWKENQSYRFYISLQILYRYCSTL